MTAGAPRLRAALLCALPVMLMSAGCGKPVLRVADASIGDYYTEKEFKKLSREQRDEYCAELTRQDSAYKAEIAETREALDALRSRSRSLRAEGDSLARIAFALEAEVAAARARPAAPGSAPTGRGASGALGRDGGGGVYRVRPGDSLWRISGLKETMGAGLSWGRIYEANRDRIRNPNLIYPGQELTIPR